MTNARRILALIAIGMALATLPARSETTVRIALTTLPPKQGNPFAAIGYPTITTTSAIFDGLTRLTKDGRLEPGLALTYEKRDERTWRFTLRPNVQFSNGKPFTAEAVVNSVTYLAGDESLGDFLRNELPRMTGARRIDDLTVEITTAQPEPMFPRYVAGLLIAEPEQWRRLGREGFARAPIGTGPFQADQWDAGRVQLKAFAGSWRKPRADRVELIELPERTARVQAVLSDRADIALDLGPEDASALAGTGGRILAWSDGGVQGISFATGRDTPLKDVRVRQALNYAVQKSQIVDVVLQGATPATGQPAARTAFGYDPAIAPYAYDPAKATALLAAAGYPNGFSFVMEGTTASPGSDSTYQLIAADLKKVGVDMRIKIVTRFQFLNNVFGSGEYADAFAMWWGTQPSLDSARAMKLHSCGQKFPWFCEPALTQKIEAALATWDEQDAIAQRHALLKAYHDAAPAIFLYDTVLFAGLSRRVPSYEDDYGFVKYEDLTLTP